MTKFKDNLKTLINDWKQPKFHDVDDIQLLLLIMTSTTIGMGSFIITDFFNNIPQSTIYDTISVTGLIFIMLISWKIYESVLFKKLHKNEFVQDGIKYYSNICGCGNIYKNYEEVKTHWDNRECHYWDTLKKV